MCKILVFGCNGMAGHMITIYLKEKGYDVTGFSRRKINFCKNINGEISDIESIKKVINDGQYDYIVNAIGVLNKNCDVDIINSVYVNSLFPHLLCELTKNKNTQIIHISTDCVFSGNNSPYDENSIKDGLSIYAKTKALGEITDNKNITFRTSIIGPDMNSKGIGLFNWFMSHNKDDVIKGFKAVNWTGITTLELAKAIEFAIYHKMSGLFNLVNNKTITKYDILCFFNDKFNKKIHIIPDCEYTTSKILTNTNECLLYKIQSYNNMFEEMFNWIKSHRDLYPQY